MPVTPNAVSVSEVDLMNVASKAQTMEAAVALSAALRVGEPRRLSTASTAAKSPKVTSADVYAADVGVG